MRQQTDFRWGSAAKALLTLLLIITVLFSSFGQATPVYADAAAVSL